MSDRTAVTDQARRPRPRRIGLWCALAVLIGLVLYAFAVPLFVDHDTRIVDYTIAGVAPSADHPLGTDPAGRDLFIRVALGLRLSLTIALIVAVASTVLGTAVGVIAGFVGGAVDQVLMRTSDTVNALPHLILSLVIVAMFRGSVPAIIVALVLSHWVTTARIIRAQTLSMRNSEVIASAWLSGMGRGQIIRHHLVPAALGQALISVLLLVPHAVWHESTFSFLGIGLPPHEPSLGTLLSDAEGGLLLGQWWLLVFPGGALIAAVLAVGVAGRALTARITGAEVRWPRNVARKPGPSGPG
ncbi:ABC transporter permease subunit [Gordonia pseudamarae]|jgi:ABC-type dipeptide/oligopeptide/nickel transport system permease subunit|uniref:ABC transporter permease subunit n=1 Tax=Gordonia pseudamarae TaxID=2831662 RepID=A0ABX6IP99_9ACTN|nr:MULTISPECIES: ABC transporter permease [Gordonia]MBD0023771.1 ABC transporter permease [Gordonia sp. (in: high G+C Gram-positive bacteria)]QHN28079.1 ABC transporter permease subunit [Gordonia pseudamarae]QHN36941.1 ABC transporter permease subunit [Gordonia pseudamarae]